MAKSKKILTLQEYRDEVSTIVAAELEHFDPDAVREEVRRRMQSSSFEIVTKALGFDNRWDRWEVDHCNGTRNKAADVMLAEAKGAAEAWLREQAGQLPTLPKSVVNALRKDYLEQLERSLSDLLRQRAHQEAQRLVNELVGSEAD